jgi:hypothetical protein
MYMFYFSHSLMTTIIFVDERDIIIFFIKIYKLVYICICVCVRFFFSLYFTRTHFIIDLWDVDLVRK